MDTAGYRRFSGMQLCQWQRVISQRFSFPSPPTSIWVDGAGPLNLHTLCWPGMGNSNMGMLECWNQSEPCFGLSLISRMGHREDSVELFRCYLRPAFIVPLLHPRVGTRTRGYTPMVGVAKSGATRDRDASTARSVNSRMATE